MKLPYRYRGVLLMSLLTLILPYAAWYYALGNTWRMWRTCRRLSAQLETMAPVRGQPLSVYSAGPEVILSGMLLEAVRSAAAEGDVQVTGYEPLAAQEQDGVALHTAQLTLAGGYIPILQVVEELEHALPRCRIFSLSWRTAADRQTRQRQLTATLYVQQIILKNQ